MAGRIKRRADMQQPPINYVSDGVMYFYEKAIKRQAHHCHCCEAVVITDEVDGHDGWMSFCQIFGSTLHVWIFCKKCAKAFKTKMNDLKKKAQKHGRP